jgi:Flp pilus assembly protein TadG
LFGKSCESEEYKTMAGMRSLINEKGASAVEFVFILPVVLLLLIGIIDFGVLFYNKQVITNACREGARAGTTRTTDPISQIVLDYCSTSTPGDRLITFNSVKPQPITTVTGGNGAFQQPLTVRVTYNYSFLAPSLIGLAPQLTVAAQTTMYMERVSS